MLGMILQISLLVTIYTGSAASGAFAEAMVGLVSLVILLINLQIMMLFSVLFPLKMVTKNNIIYWRCAFVIGNIALCFFVYVQFIIPLDFPSLAIVRIFLTIYPNLAKY